MNCANHGDVAAVAYCRACGKALCPACERTVQGTVFCDEHAPQMAGAAAGPGAPLFGASPYTGAAPPPYSPNLSVSPGLAFILGLIPGVGAIYNGQYAKGLVHVLVLGVLIAIMSNGAAGSAEPLFGLMISAWFFYMAFEAYHTAKRRQFGLPVDEFSSILPLRGKGFPLAPVVLICLGVLFLLNNLDLIRFRDVARFWPLFLIAVGAYMLYARIASARQDSVGEALNERN